MLDRRADHGARVDARRRIDPGEPARRVAERRAAEQRAVRLDVALRGRVLGEVAGLVLERGDGPARAQPRQVALADHARLAVGQAGHHRRARDVDAAEHVRAGAEDVVDPAVPDVDRAPVERVGDAADDHHAEEIGRRRGGPAVRGDQRGDVEIEDQLAVARHERLVAAVRIEQREGVLEAAAGAEDRVLVDVVEARAVLPAVAELAPDHVAQVVRVDDQLGEAVRDEVRDPVREDREAAHRQHRLGALGAQRAEARRQAGAQEHRPHRAPPWHSRRAKARSEPTSQSEAAG